MRIRRDYDHELGFLKASAMSSVAVRESPERGSRKHFTREHQVLGQKHWDAEWESFAGGLQWHIDCCVPVAVYSLQTWTWSPQCHWSKWWRCRTLLPAPSPLVLAALLLNCMREGEREKGRERGVRSKCLRLLIITLEKCKSKGRSEENTWMTKDV